jgi:dipeptidyl aminopeptidase/acylaminoacyl peptidase
VTALNLVIIPVGVLAFALVTAAIANRFIRTSLAAPRMLESGVPDGLPWREVRIATVRGKTLFGWFIPAGDNAPALAVIHGWGGNAEMMLPLAKPLHAAGYALLFFDARSHGRSDGDNFASLPRFAEDLEHAVDWLRGQAQVDASRSAVIGHSVGAGAALLLASRRQDLRAVVSLAAFAHPAAMMRRWLKSKQIPYWPLGAYILYYVQRVIGFRFDDIAPSHTIRAVNCPVLLAHGTEDEMVPASEAEEIYANRSSDQARLLLMPGSHDEYGDIERHIETVVAFLDRAVGMKDAFNQGNGQPEIGKTK